METAWRHGGVRATIVLAGNSVVIAARSSTIPARLLTCWSSPTRSTRRQPYRRATFCGPFVLKDAGYHAMGHNTYRDMAGFWPVANDGFSNLMNSIPKLIFTPQGAGRDRLMVTVVARTRCLHAKAGGVETVLSTAARSDSRVHSPFIGSWCLNTGAHRRG